jgi:Holliday junction resolvase RusA-like endonuclease
VAFKCLFGVKIALRQAMSSQAIELVIPGVPVVWRAPYVGSRGAYSPKHNEKRIVQTLLKSMYKGDLIKSVICCDIYFHLPIPKSTSKKKQALMREDDIRPTAGGDLTNLRKFYEDCLQEIVIENDRQIVEGETGKWYDDEPRTVVLISPI